ncbi:MAG: tetratricopeptide repeat protein [Steroidobacteraceae bacterium]
MRNIVLAFVGALLLAGCGRVNPETAVADAQKLIAEGKPGEARILLKNALAKANNNVPGARQLLSRITLNEGDPKGANDELTALDATVAAEPATAALKAEVALELGRREDAAKLLDAAGDAIPEPNRTALRARLLRMEGKAGEALVLLRTAQQAQPGDEKLAIEAAECLGEMGALDAAVAEMDRYLADEKRPKASALHSRGEMLLRQGNNKRGIEDLRAAVAAAPKDWPVAQRLSSELLIGEALLMSGDSAGARAQVAHISEIWPGLLGSEILLGRLDLLDGRYAQAAERLGKAADAAPGNARLQYLWAEALARAGNITRATEVLEKRVAVESSKSPARPILAKLLLQQGKPARVIELLGEDPSEDEGRNALLQAARDTMNRADKQISALTNQLAKEPDNGPLRAQLALAQIASGQSSAAMATLGPLPKNGLIPETTAARMAALLAAGNELEGNHLVDRLLDPTTAANAVTLVAAADVAQRNNQPSMSSRLLDRAAELEPTSTEVQLRRANSSFEGKRFEEAEKFLRELLQKQPDNLVAGVALGRALEAKGDLPGARKALAEAAKQSPKAMEPNLMLAAIELRAGHVPEAGKAFDALIAAKPDGVLANAAGQLLAESDHFAEAKARFQQAVEQDAKNAQYWSNLGRAQLSLKDRDAARDSFLKSLELQPSVLTTAAAAVRLSIEKKDFATAKRAAQLVVTALPNSYGSWLLQGEAGLAAGDANLANNAFARASAITPSAKSAIGEFQARLMLKTQRPEAPLLAWVAREPGDLDVQHMLIDYSLQAGDSAAVRRQTEGVLKRFPNDTGSLNNLAWLLRDSDPAKAEKLASQAQAIAPDNALIADTLGMVYLAGGKNDDALKVLAAAAAKLPENQTLQYHHALALSRAGKKAEARGVLQKALQGNTDFDGRSDARALMEKL